MTFPDHGFVLLALPKTGSTTLERTLAPYASLVISSPPARPVAPPRLQPVDRPDVWGRWFAERLGRPLDFGRHNASTAGRGELSDDARSALRAHFAPEYDVWSRLQETGMWSGARGTRLRGG
jgi:hypothetical protein